MTPRIIAVVNQKGGVGKTTTTLNLGAALARSGRRVLLVDVDPQGSLTVSAGMEETVTDQSTTIAEVLLRGADIADALLDNVCSGFDLVPADIRLSAADLQLASVTGREFVLKEALAEIGGAYDYILIDCPPNLSHLTINALTAAGSVLIVQQAHYLALSGAALLLDTIKLIKRRVNPGLAIKGVLLTMFDGRTNHAKEIRDQVQEFFGDKVYKTVIRSSIALADAPAQGKDIFQFNPRAKAAADYEAFAREIIEQEARP